MPRFLGVVAALALASNGLAVPQSGALLGWQQHAEAISPTVQKELGDLGGTMDGAIPDPAKTRHYYVAAENVVWCFDPAGADPVCAAHAGPGPANKPYFALKLRYFQYTDETFSTRVLENPRLGLLGPALRGVVGEYIAVTFLNKTEFPLSMHPHGVKYDKNSEGAYYKPQPGLGAAVGPGARFTYIWRLDEASGPLPTEPSSKCWLYHSHVCGDEEANLGLVGLIIVTDPQRARPDGTPIDVDREMAALFMLHDENFPPPPNAAPGTSSGGEPDEQNVRYAINGCDYDSLRGLEMNEGERVRWYLFGLGDEQDQHTAHWHGLRVIEDGRRRTDVVELLPASMKIADMVADNQGTWLFHCHVAEHMKNGMFARIAVDPKNSPGVNTDPACAFLGLKEAEQQMRIERAVRIKRVPGLADSLIPRLQLNGSAAIGPNPLDPTAMAITVQIGLRKWTFTPDKSGQAKEKDWEFNITNLSPTGWVAGAMQFRLLLPWPAEGRGAEALVHTEVHLQLGDVSYTAFVGAPADTAIPSR